MLFRETAVVYSEKYAKHINTLYSVLWIADKQEANCRVGNWNLCLYIITY
jgi:hypothetical protein